MNPLFGATFVFTILLIVPVTGFADSTQPPSLSGALRLDYFSSSRSLDDRRDFFSTTAEGKLEQDFSDQTSALIQARGSLFELGHNTYYGKATLLQGFLHMEDKAADWRLGKQWISWGRADAVNPIDFFTPHDYTIMLPLEQDQRLALTASRLDYHFAQNNELSVVAAPDFQPTSLPTPAQSPISVNETEPATTWKNIQWGMRFNHEGDSVGWSLAGFHGFNSFPLLTPNGFIGSTLNFTRYYPRIDALGGDFASNFGRFGFRAEMAYIKPTDNENTPPLSPYWFGVMGVDRSFEDTWNVNLQFIVRTASRYVNANSYTDPSVQLAATQNAITYGLINRFNTGLTSRIAGQWFYNTLTAELLTYVYFNPRNYALRPMVTYALNDNTKVILGGEYYEGSDLSFFGQLKRNRTVFFELNYGF